MKLPRVPVRRTAGLGLLAVGLLWVVLLGGCSTAGSGGAAGRGSPAQQRPSSGESGDRSPSPVAPAVAATVARPVPTPCTTNARSRWVFVSLRRQHMWLCGRHRVVKDSAITSGMRGQYTETPTGDYRIQGRNRNTTLTLNTGATYDVKYWIPFDAPLFGFHDASWQDFPYGSARYKTAGSHGCIHLPLATIRFLYAWADVGTPVRIRA